MGRSAFGLIIRDIGANSAAVCPSVTLCGGRPATAMMGGDDNITQNVDRNERERGGDKDEGRGRMQARGMVRL